MSIFFVQLMIMWEWQLVKGVSNSGNNSNYFRFLFPLELFWLGLSFSEAFWSPVATDYPKLFEV